MLEVGGGEGGGHPVAAGLVGRGALAFTKASHTFCDALKKSSAEIWESIRFELWAMAVAGSRPWSSVEL